LFIADLVRFRGDLERDLLSLAEIVAANSTAAIAFDDPRAAAETLGALRARPVVWAACIYRADGRRFAEYFRAGVRPHPLPPLPPPDGAHFGSGMLRLASPIRLPGQRIGTVYLEAGLADMYARLRWQVATVTVVLLAAAALALLLSSRLQRVISEPILELAATATAVSRQQDYSLRAERRSRDELGSLVDAFNQMLSQIGDRDRQLQRARDELEQRVVERTAELRQELAERRRAERELAERNVLLDQSNRELDDFAYIASHDLKEPLRGIHNFARFLLEDYGGQLDDEGRAKLETLVRLSRRMEALIDSLLHYSRVGRVDLAMDRVDLNAVLEAALDSLSVQIQESGIEVRVPRRLPPVRCDRVRIGEVFQNLVANAIKYNDKAGGRWVEIGFSTAAAAAADPGAAAAAAVDAAGSRRPFVFFVRDNGMGIPGKHFEAIFRIFKRLHGRERFGGGTGAGLTIVKKIVERHQGRVWLESVMGEGTTFYFTLEREGGT
ncbi:MAG TPA: ATP-binding protein, partial [Thermoanaerobaculia bacterium]|nr:ATP-binding protein [Thermoanaerobaculia bacterium]